jgi:hypothetical protein
VSIPVPLADLPAQVERFGSTPYLVTVGEDSTPHAASVAVVWRDNLLMAGAGRRTASNIQANDVVALLWPAKQPGQHALIVDGLADVKWSGDGLVVLIQPSRAVLHVTSRGEEG